MKSYPFRWPSELKCFYTKRNQLWKLYLCFLLIKCVCWCLWCFRMFSFYDIFCVQRLVCGLLCLSNKTRFGKQSNMKRFPELEILMGMQISKCSTFPCLFLETMKILTHNFGTRTWNSAAFEAGSCAEITSSRNNASNKNWNICSGMH